MIVVKVSTGASDLSSLFLRQTPGAKGVWGGCRFILNEEIKSCDWWIVCHRSGLVNTESTHCDPNNIVYISMEGSEALAGGGTSDRFIKQFSKIISWPQPLGTLHSLHSFALNTIGFSILICLLLNNFLICQKILIY